VETINQYIDKAAVLAEVPVKVTADTLRRSFAVEMYATGCNLLDLMLILGFGSFRETLSYILSCIGIEVPL
jgi:site-specific recombinase XerD